MKVIASVVGFVCGSVAGYRLTRNTLLAVIGGLSFSLIVYDLFVYQVE